MSGTCNDGKHISTFMNTVNVGGESWSHSQATQTLHGPQGRIMWGIPTIEAAFYAVAGLHGGLRFQNPF